MNHFDRAIIDDPAVFKVNTLPAHSDTVLYGSVEEMQAHRCDLVRRAGSSSLEKCLNGMWRFHYPAPRRPAPATLPVPSQPQWGSPEHN